MDYLPIIVISVCAIFFYRAGRYEKSWGILWAALSILTSFLALYFLNVGMVGVLGAQAVLFVLITFYRMRNVD